jgi:hypothetical protein
MEVLLHYVQRAFGLETMIDIGCGPGESSGFSKSNRVIMLSVLMVIGLYFPKHENFHLHDFTTGPWIPSIPTNLIWLGLLNF